MTLYVTLDDLDFGGLPEDRVMYWRGRLGNLIVLCGNANWARNSVFAGDQGKACKEMSDTLVAERERDFWDAFVEFERERDGWSV